MRRRSFLGALGSVGICGLPLARASASQNCGMSPIGPVCTSYIPIQQLGKSYRPQQMSEWCWAASISMIFTFNGHPISQDHIVADAYGSVANIPGNYPAMFGSLNRGWVDENGQNFSVEVKKAFAPAVGFAGLTNGDLAQELANGYPVLYCTSHHAMVLTSISYNQARVLEAWVMDPWPGNGLRRLTQVEWVPEIYGTGGQLSMAASLEFS